MFSYVCFPSPLGVMFGTPSICKAFAICIAAYFCMRSSRSASFWKTDAPSLLSPCAQVAECIQWRCRRRRMRPQEDCNLPNYPWRHVMHIYIYVCVCARVCVCVCVCMCMCVCVQHPVHGPGAEDIRYFAETVDLDI